MIATLELHDGSGNWRSLVLNTKAIAAITDNPVCTSVATIHLTGGSTLQVDVLQVVGRPLSLEHSLQARSRTAAVWLWSFLTK